MEEVRSNTDHVTKSDNALVASAVKSTLGTTSVSASKTSPPTPVHFEWTLSRDALESILKDVAYGIHNLKTVVDTMQPSLQDFETKTVVALWNLATIESDTTGVPHYATGNYTFVYLVSTDELSSSMPERLIGLYQRTKISVQDLCPGGMYRGKPSLTTQRTCSGVGRG
jgi:hypothetical protein